MTETLTWHPASRKPDSDTTVLCWLDTGDWIAGWWDAEINDWRDCTSGGLVSETVTAWAKPQGPEA